MKSVLSPRLFLMLAIICAITNASCSARPVSPFEKIREESGYQEYEYRPNGLRVLLRQDNSLPIVSVLVTYKVGSRFETTGEKGIAHLIEHMMFRGTPRYHKDHGTAVFTVLQSLGAGIHGATWADGMEFVDILPSDQLEKALDIEADRMRFALFKPEDLKAEMPVVQSEFDLMENSPEMALQNAVWAEAFQVHPYHFSEIGLRPDIEKASPQDLRKFYDLYFQPGNAVVTLSGRFEPQTALHLIEKTLGTLPKGKTGTDPSLPEPAQTQARRTEVMLDDPSQRVMIAHKIPEAGHPDLPALDVFSQLLCGGMLSRLYSLVDEGLASSISCSAGKNRAPSLFMTQVTLSPGTRHEEIEQKILAAYRQLQDAPAPEAEIIRAKNKILAAHAFGQDGFFNAALELSYAISFGDWTLYPLYPRKIRQVTAEDVQRAAKKYFTAAASTTGYLRSRHPAPPLEAPASKAAAPAEPVLSREPAALIPEPSAAGEEILPEKLAERMEVRQASPLETIALKTRIPGVITIAGSFEGGGTAYAENRMIALLTADVLPQGTLTRDKYELTRFLEERGIELSFNAGTERLQFQARFMKNDLDAVIRLLAEILRTPAFPETEFWLAKKLRGADLKNAAADTGDLASRALRQKMYTPGHPYYLPSQEDDLRELNAVTLEQIREFHKNSYGPQKMLLVAVGDVDASSFQKSAAAAFDGWETHNLLRDFPRSVPLLPQTPPVRLQVPEKVNIDVRAGHTLPLLRTSPDYVPLWMANRMLGGDFMSRLFNKIRDEKGLSYHIYSFLNGIEADMEGHLEINMTVNRKTLAEGLSELQKEFAAFAQDAVSSEILQKVKSSAAGNFKVSLGSTRNLAGLILMAREAGLPAEYPDLFPEIISSVSAEQITQAIRTYIKPENLQITLAGDWEEKKTAAA